MLDMMIYDCNILNLALSFKCGYSGIRGLGFGYWGIRIFWNIFNTNIPNFQIT
jgi:hypothetical protein